MTFKELFVEIYYGDYSKERVLKRINEYIENNEIIEVEFFELLESAVDQESLLLQLIQTTDSSFSADSVEAEILTARYFLNILEHYENGQIRPFDLCRIFNNIEIGFMGAQRNLPLNIAYYPLWTGNLYHACDWCDETWTLENSPHLGIEVKKQIRIIKDWLANPSFK
ncbi:hypothetical protein F907_02160 [Acinetobacter colistiniresistens]|uniref:Uncharacterized protein n=1 Tax=Acinetobacter colistiniresistens TaxID=280145 RepID=S3TB80_9GAMM|nr:hypothetical protein [Acinetobacter colistiniresistens]EPG38188.1 hypothetical protein F907_02160 [Acinetobacter colistiniresistens]TVT86253.1 hypothetical protein FPV60_03345 [Acinetobacter colistiniresistens]